CSRRFRHRAPPLVWAAARDGSGAKPDPRSRARRSGARGHGRHVDVHRRGGRFQLSPSRRDQPAVVWLDGRLEIARGPAGSGVRRRPRGGDPRGRSSGPRRGLGRSRVRAGGRMRKKDQIVILALGVVGAALAATRPSRAGTSSAPTNARETLSFPRDHGSHPDAPVEWWYFTGHLQDPEHNEYGFQVTFFRVHELHLAHFAWTNVHQKTFEYAEKTHL